MALIVDIYQKQTCLTKSEEATSVAIEIQEYIKENEKPK
jgi:hypothetical protein